jgi:hypothetical protein
MSIASEQRNRQDHLNKTEKALLQDKDGKDKAEQEDIEHQKTNRVF